MSEAMGEPNFVLSILVVDDDATCLSLITGCLQKRNHHVIATKNPLDALCTLRMKWQSFDLILTDVHMPEMSGLDLLNHSVEEDFKIPLILMSADTDAAIMQQGLKDGAAFYFVKPMALEFLQRVWQFALPQNPNRGPVPPFGMLGIENGGLGPHNNFNNNNNNNNYPAFFNIYEAGDVLRFPQNHMVNQANNNNNNNVNLIEEQGNAGRRKPKLIWTTSLHNQFLEAVNKLGLDRAVPKKILEYMNVPGLKRENVASHLQKYRIFLKRISTQQGIANNWNERPFRSSFVLNEISFLTNNLQRQYQQLIGKTQEKGQTSTQAIIPPGEDPNQKVAISSPGDTGMQAPQEPSEIVSNRDNPSSIAAHHQEAISTGSITVEGNFHGGIPSISQGTRNLQCVPNTYVGLRLTSDGELVGTLRDMPMRPEGNQSFANGISDGANLGANPAQEITGNSPLNAPLTNIFGVENQENVYIPNLVENVTHQEPGFGVTQEVLSSDNVDQQEIFGGDFSLESYDRQGNALGNFVGFDSGVFHNDDFSLDYYYMQEHGHNFGDFTQDGGFDFTYLD